MIPEPTSPSTIFSSPGGQRNQRYTYLVARLRNRQMTMEEATELYTLMDGMLRASEAARLAVMRTPAAPMPERAALPIPKAAPAATAPSAGDDFFLLGILAMGAGAGLLAAMTKRMQDLAPSPSNNERRASPRSNSP